MIVGQTISSHARTQPLAPALTWNGETLNYGDLEILLCRTATWLASASQAGRTIAIDLPHSPALAIIFLAVIRLGREAQVLDTAWPDEMRRQLLDSLRPDIVVSCRSGQASTLYLSRENLGIRRFMGTVSLFPELDTWPSIDPRAAFYTGFTSGTTGAPKGYTRNHYSWIRSFEAAQSAFPLSTNSVVIAPGTLTHSLFLFAFAYAIEAGAHCILITSFRPNRVLSLAREYGATHLFVVPSQSAMIAKTCGKWGSASALRWLISSGSKWRVREHQALRALFPHARSVEFYGTSETSFIAVREAGGPAPEVSVGKPFASVEIRIYDAGGRLAACGEPGRIFVKSDMLFERYAGNEAADYDEDGFLATQDCGIIDASGYLTLTGRHNRMIVTSGNNLFPEEIERALEQHVHIDRAAVIALEDDKRDERLVAIVRADGAVSRAQLIAHMKTLLPLFKIPRTFLRIEHWPETRSGKIDLATLKSDADSGKLEVLK